MKTEYINEKLSRQIMESYGKLVCPMTDCDFTVGINNVIDISKSQMAEHICSHDVEEIDFMSKEEIDDVSKDICPEHNIEMYNNECKLCDEE